MQDTIERSIDITAPLDRVWDLVTEPGWWVPTDAPVTAERTPGAVVVRESQQWGRFPVEVVELRPRTYAAFRWSPHLPRRRADPGPHHADRVHRHATDEASGSPSRRVASRSSTHRRGQGDRRPEQLRRLDGPAGLPARSVGGLNRSCR